MRSLMYVGALCVSLNAHAAEVELPVKVKIINLTHETLEDAIAFCDERNMACPELRAQYDPVSKVEFEPLPQDLNEIEPAGGVITIREGTYNVE